MARDQAPLVPIASILRAQGRRGAVRVRIEIDDARLFTTGRRVVMMRGERKIDTTIEAFRSQHGRSVVKLEGVDSISEAESWIGGRIAVAKTDVPQAEEGSFFGFDLVGCSLHANGVLIGPVTEVLDYGSAPLLRVDREGEEILIPFAEAYLKKVDIGAKRIEVELPEGLIEK